MPEESRSKVALKRWRIAVLMISFIGILWRERLKRRGTSTSALTSLSSQCAKKPSTCQSPGLKGQQKPLIPMYLQDGVKIPFLPFDIREKLEAHIRHKQSQRLWGFCMLVTRYVGDPFAVNTILTSSEDKKEKMTGKIISNVSNPIGQGQ